MRLFLVIVASLLLFIFPIFLIADEYSAENEQYKKANIDKLKPYGPGFNENQRPIWQKMMKIAVKYEDYEIVEKILLVRDEVDGVMATQYSLDLFELYKQSPLFFIESVDKFYAGNFDKFLRIWINEAYDITINDIKKFSTGHTENKLMKKFLLEAEALDSQIK
jgi:hypothetical protein